MPMIKVVKSPQPIAEKKHWTVFLAGPMNGAPSWQAQVPKVAAKVGLDNVTFLNPRKTDRFVTHSTQLNWETFGLRMADVILFWIPPQARKMKPHRVYAITTRMEFAENCARGHKIIFGLDPEVEELTGISHLKHLAKYYGIKKVHSTLEDCLKELTKWLESRESQPKEHHVTGPAFDSMESLKRSFPLKNRNQTLMEQWNQTVGLYDTVYVEGEFGSGEWIKFLNGEIHIA